MVGLYSLEEKLELLKDEAYKNNDNYSLDIIESLKRDTPYERMLERIDFYSLPSVWSNTVFFEERLDAKELSNEEKFDKLFSEIKVLLEVKLIDENEHDLLRQELEITFLSW